MDHETRTTRNTADTPQAAAFDAVLDARYSCRGYLATPVPREVIDAILRAAPRSAPPRDATRSPGRWR